MRSPSENWLKHLYVLGGDYANWAKGGDRSLARTRVQSGRLMFRSCFIEAPVSKSSSLILFCREQWRARLQLTYSWQARMRL